MKDIKYINLLIKKWLGRADDKDHQALDSWMESSDEHKAFAQDAEKAWDWSADYQKDFEPNVEAGLSKFKSRISAEHSPTAKVVKVQSRRRFLQVAAAIALLLGAGFLLRNAFVDSTNWIELQTAMSETKTVTLEDGTTIVLNEGSTLTYPEAIIGNERKVKLVGEAFFDVARDEQKPFLIETNLTEIEVLGTSFNVDASLDKAITEVQVKTGKVRFSPKRSEKALLLEKDDKGTFNSQTNILKSEEDPTLNTLAWHSKKLTFKKTNLAKVIKDLEQYFKVKINLDDARMGQCKYTSLYNNPDLDTMLQALAVAFDLHLKQLNQTTYTLKGGHCN